MNPLSQLFSGPENLFWFLSGIVSVQVWQWIKCKYKDRTDPLGAPHKMKKLNWFYVWTAVVLLIIVGVAIQGAATYTFAERLSKSVADCQVEFNQAFVDNRKINDLDRKLAFDWQKATFDRAQQLTLLANKLGPTSDAYLEAKALVDAQYFKNIQLIEVWRINNETNRVPYPEPTCGRKITR